MFWGAGLSMHGVMVQNAITLRFATAPPFGRAGVPRPTADASPSHPLGRSSVTRATPRTAAYPNYFSYLAPVSHVRHIAAPVVFMYAFFFVVIE
jgi:hypothetical protein